MHTLLYSSAKARAKITQTSSEFEKLVDGSMQYALVGLVHDNEEFQMHIVNTPRLFELFIVKGFYEAFYELLGCKGSKEAQKIILENDYLFTLCLQNSLLLMNIIPLYEKEIDKRFQNNAYFRTLAIQNVEDHDLGHIFRVSTDQWPELTDEVIQHFVDMKYSTTLDFLKYKSEKYGWKLKIPEIESDYRVDYVVQITRLSLQNHI